MSRKIKKNAKTIAILCVLLFLFGVMASVLSIVFLFNPAKIDVSQYVLISDDGSGSYQFAIDKDRIRYDFCFPDNEKLPENIALNSLSLIVSPSVSSVHFEVGSYLEDAGAMLSSGGYVLYNTVWNWTTSEITSEYASSLKVPKHISLKRYVRFRSDGNYNWIPYIDYPLLFESVGDRIEFDSSLKSVMSSLSVSANSCSDGSIKIETWSSFSSPSGLSVDNVLHSCGVTITDTVFLVNIEDILATETQPLSLKSFCVYSHAENGINVKIDKESIITTFGFSSGSAAAEAIDALSVYVENRGNYYYISAYFSATDLDVVSVLLNNGVSLQDTEFTISE